MFFVFGVGDIVVFYYFDFGLIYLYIYCNVIYR